MADEASAGASKTQGLRDAISSKLRLGKGGNKVRRGTTPRTSGISERQHLSRRTSSVSSHQGEDISSLSLRLRRLNEAGLESIPFRIKFVNHKNEATMADVYPTEEYKDVIRKIVEKLRMPHQSNYVLLYMDTDAEEIGVACTDNLREMFSIFEPGSRLQLRIVQLNINNAGALDSIPSIWDNGHTPNVFLHARDDGSDGHSVSSGSSSTSGNSMDLEKLKLATALVPEMEEKPKPAVDTASVHSHLAVEDIADVAVAAATAASAAAAASALASAVGKKTDEEPGASNASNKAEPPSSPPSSPKVTATEPPPSPPPAAAAAAAGGGDELRTAIAMMSTNLTLAIESLGTKLATNFDRLSTEQAKIIDSLEHAKTANAECVEAAALAAAAAAVVADKKVTVTESVEVKVEDAKVEVEEKVEVKVEKVEEKVEVKVEEKVEKVEEKVEAKVEAKIEEKTTEVKITEVKVDDVDAKSDKSDTETIHIEVTDAKPSLSTKDSCTGSKQQADIFKDHLLAANAFAFHSNPYASSFFQHGFSEVGMPSYIRHPCMLRTPFNEPVCGCTGGGSCSVCLTRKLAEMGYAVNEMQVSSLLGVYNGDPARVIEHVVAK
ncbi:hypothetical protein GGI20_003808 [Coemansia sp. BCRC 34301]|nr:hypothetical protein GGI20_003808 [Coemansia sp. BCRC 34301]